MAMQVVGVMDMLAEVMLAMDMLVVDTSDMGRLRVARQAAASTVVVVSADDAKGDRGFGDKRLALPSRFFCCH
jgi:hypothetical protein